VYHIVLGMSPTALCIIRYTSVKSQRLPVEVEIESALAVAGTLLQGLVEPGGLRCGMTK
jgi:hypothetical protein